MLNAFKVTVLKGWKWSTDWEERLKKRQTFWKARTCTALQNKRIQPMAFDAHCSLYAVMGFILYLFLLKSIVWCIWQNNNPQLSSLGWQVCQGFPACLGRRRNGWRSQLRLTLSTGSTRASTHGSRSSPGCHSNGRASWRTLPTAQSPWWTPPTSPPSSLHQWR